MSANHPHCTKRHPFAPADNHTHFFKKHPIDLVLYEKYCKFAKSLLNRTNNERCFLTRVTPYAGVWIETDDADAKPLGYAVTPYAGVWIKTAVILIKVQMQTTKLTHA